MIEGKFHYIYDPQQYVGKTQDEMLKAQDLVPVTMFIVEPEVKLAQWSGAVGPSKKKQKKLQKPNTLNLKLLSPKPLNPMECSHKKKAFITKP